MRWWSDVGVKQQLLTACLVAAAVSLFEAVLFFRVLTPEVNESLRRLLDSAAPTPPPEGLPTSSVRTALAIAEEREGERQRDSERQAVANAALIVSAPLLVALMLWVGSASLRSASLRPVLTDCATVLGGIVFFEGLFYVLGHRWRYLGDAELRLVVARRYLLRESREKGSSVMAGSGGKAEGVVV